MGHSITNESEDGILSADSPVSNDGDNFGGNSNSGIVLKKGPWTSAEDAILVEYVKKHGEGNWNAVQKHTGLLRCGKSCRLRWANHLRPNLKKGAFTSEEERLIVELHAKMGNKWARMAAHLPGRTDNEIKNYWNTRIKRRQRAGLPLYSPELCLQGQPENHQVLNPTGIHGGGTGCQDMLQRDGYKTSDFIFDGSNILPCTSKFSDISVGGSLTNGFGCPQFYSFVPQTRGLQKYTPDTDDPMSDYGGDAVDVPPSFDRACSDKYENKMSQSLGPCFPYDPDHTEKLLPPGVDQDSQFVSNWFFSASKPTTGAEKFELPSLQHQETGFSFWDPAPESLDSFMQSSICGPPSSDCPSPRSSGLLEALLYEAKALSKSGNHFSEKPPIFTAGENTDSAAMTTCSVFGGNPDLTFPSPNTLGSVFNEQISTHTAGSSLEEKMPVCSVKSKVVDQGWNLGGEQKEELVCSRPDAILESSWLEQTAVFAEQKGSATDPIAAFINDDDFGDELNSSWGLNSCTWNNMPAVCQMSDRRLKGSDL